MRLPICETGNSLTECSLQMERVERVFIRLSLVLRLPYQIRLSAPIAVIAALEHTPVHQYHAHVHINNTLHQEQWWWCARSLLQFFLVGQRQRCSFGHARLNSVALIWYIVLVFTRRNPESSNQSEHQHRWHPAGLSR